MKIIVFFIAALLHVPLVIIVVVFRYIGEVSNQICFWSCYLMAKIFNYSGDYQTALEWLKMAGRIK